MTITFKKISFSIAAVLIAAVLLGLITAWILPTGTLGSSFLSYSIFSAIIFILLVLIWQIAGGGKKLFYIMLIAFILRVLLGIFFTWGLPILGYDEEVQRSGYFFADAFTRDGYAWRLASSSESLLNAFGGEFMADQYGGLLALSALVYRVFSPDVHRPIIMSLLSAGVSAAGIPFLVSALRKRFGNKLAWTSAWILALYPESLLLGASQMREPYLITLFAISFWSTLRLLDRQINWKTVIGVFIGIIGMVLISYRVAIPVLGVLLIWTCLEGRGRLTERKWIVLFWAVIGISLVGIAAVSWRWLQSAMHWDIVQSYTASGWIQYLFKTLPGWMKTPFIIIYGIFQPLLPAAIADPAPWIWRVVGILRGVGWYAILPLIIFPLFRVWKIKDRQQCRLTLWLILAVWAWILLASIRAGGDQWDNPRYRNIFLPWMAGTAAWTIAWAREKKDKWLVRIILIEGIFLLFFTHWYLGRYYNLFVKLQFWHMIALILILSLVVLIIGFLVDRTKERKQNQQST